MIAIEVLDQRYSHLQEVEQITPKYKINSKGRWYNPLNGRFLRMPQSLDRESKVIYMPGVYLKNTAGRLYDPNNGRFVSMAEKAAEPIPTTTEIVQENRGSSRWFSRFKEKASEALSKIPVPHIPVAKAASRLAMAGILAMGLGVGEMTFNQFTQQKIVVGASDLAAASELNPKDDLIEPIQGENGQSFWSLPGQSREIRYDIFHRRQAQATADTLAERNANVDDLANQYMLRNGYSAQEFQTGQVIPLEKVLNDGQRQWISALRSTPLDQKAQFDEQLERAKQYGL